METIRYIEEVRKNRGKLTGLGTGFTELDYYTSGLQPSDLIYIAARPSMGKTAFALNLAQHAATRENAVVAMFSLEMSKTQLMQRMLCSEGLIDLTKMRSGDLDETDWSILGLGTGFTELDYYTSGLQPSDLIYIAARPSMGKTAFALNLAQHAATRENAVVAMFSLEMSKTQLMQRMLCSEGLIDLTKMRSGDLDETDWSILGEVSTRLFNTQIKIDDSAGLTLGDIRSKSRRLKSEQGLDMILIDYLQLMSSRGRSENRQNEISEISRGLKALARELHCPVVCLSQLSRAPDGRPDHHPMLADLRESGSIEQDADVVMFGRTTTPCWPTSVNPAPLSRMPMWSCFSTESITTIKKTPTPIWRSSSLPNSVMAQRERST